MAALVLAILTVAPVAAGGGPSDDRLWERGQSASTFNYDCVEDSPRAGLVTCDFDDVTVFQGRRGGTIPEYRFSGYEVCISMSRSVFDSTTGDIVRDRQDVACPVLNKPSLEVEFEPGVNGATLSGTVRLDTLRCTYANRDQRCEQSTRVVAVDLSWTGRGSVGDAYGYFRYTKDGCETTETITGRDRRARVRGHVGAKDLGSAWGQLAKTEFTATHVCQ
jgi:hypothetical protein